MSKTKTRLYRIWQKMRQRCGNPSKDNYHRYGGRGITVCAEWLRNFAAFRDWAMANGYRDDLTLDRKDNDKGYSPDNCRWATPTEQQNNLRTNHKITIGNETLTVAEWARRAEMRYDTLQSRLKAGWSPEKAVFTPVMTLSQRAKNNLRATEHLVTVHGETRNIREWSRVTGISESTICSRINRGWTPERAVSE